MKRVPIPFREITVHQPLDGGCETKEQTLAPSSKRKYMRVCIMMDLYTRMTVSNFIGQVVGFYEKFGFSVL